MKMLVVFVLLFAFAVNCKCSIVQTPLLVANPYSILADEILLRTEALDQLDETDIAIAPLHFLSNLILVNSSDPCSKSIEQFVRDVAHAKSYAVQMLDSWGKPGSGIEEGNLKWIGRYYECLRSQPQHFKPKYCTTYIGGHLKPALYGLSVQPGITVAGCFPDDCSELNITSLFSPLVDIFNVSTSFSDCPKYEVVWKTKDIIGLVLLIFLVSIVTASSLYEYVSTRKESKKYELVDQLHSNQSSPNNDTKHKILSSFSVISNTKKLLSTEQKASDIHCLHGMRFFSMCWVILGHTFVFPSSFSDNIMFMARFYVQHWEFQAVGNATYSVDTFFFLSGLLVTFLGLRQLQRRGGAMNAPLMYLFRYLRLTPAYALLIFLSVSVYPKLASGPMWSDVTGRVEDACSKYWFTNLLYINNLYPEKNQCFSWGWYLADDTQYYILAPLFLYLLHRHRTVGLALLSSVLLASVVITGIFSSITNAQPPAIGLGVLAKAALLAKTANSSFPVPVVEQQYSSYVSDIYTKPWCRIGAYIVGMLTGFVIYNYNNKMRMPKIVALLGWTVFATTACALVYGLYPTFSDLDTPLSASVLNNNVAAFYNAISRPLWAICLAWVTIACTNGYGGPVNAFLSWKAFIPLSRLTYCTYLVHPMVFWWLLGTTEALFHYSIQLTIMVFTGTLILSSLLAFIIAMIIEYPISSLMKILQAREDCAISTNPIATSSDGDVTPLVS